MPALFFGSISSVTDTSEMQRDAFNRAFREHGLDWEWDRDTYRSLLDSSGGADRVAEYARSRGEEVDAASVHATKSSLFQQSLKDANEDSRAGVRDTLRAARDAGWKTAFVTTTAPENVEAVLSGADGAVSRDDFDAVFDVNSAQESKPDPEVYRKALDQLGVQADQAVAVEDNVPGTQAAHAAGLKVVAFPNENTAGHDFPDADLVARDMSFDQVSGLVAS